MSDAGGGDSLETMVSAMMGSWQLATTVGKDLNI